MDNDKNIERLRSLANLFLKNNLKAFITDYGKNFFFCDIIYVCDDYVLVENFSGQKKGQQERIFFLNIERFEEYKERGEDGKSN